jgi:serine/threonine protein kinase
MTSDSDSQCETKVLAPRLATGQSLKHFQLETVLGEGGMGVVYRANDTQLYRPVAVKVLPPELTADSNRKQRFLQEARAAARINHPAVAQIFYVDEDRGVTFIVMELVEGKTVRDLIQGGELDLLGVIDVVAQAADGLAKAHELGIVHRDIKPANIMVTRDGHVKILDFGLAKLLDSTLNARPAIPDPATAQAVTTVPGVLMGTAAYMSPEQVRGATLDGRADLFSLGVLLSEMATGHSPFQRETFVDTLHAVAFDEPPPLASLRGHLPQELQRIVSRCLNKRPEDRYPDARLLARDLRELRRRTEPGLLPHTNWQMRMRETWDRLRHLPPSRYIWLLIVVGVAIRFAWYSSQARIGTAGLVVLAVTGLLIYRNIRNSPQRLQDAFVRRMAKIPEVRLVTIQARQFTVVVDRPVPQLYARINQQLQHANRRLLFGGPMTAAILHNLPSEKTDQLLAAPGVQYVREDILKKPPPVPASG